MEGPVDIAFHNCQRSETVEAEIRGHVDKLEKRFPQMTGCRVSVEALHNQHRTGNVWEVHVVLSVPGRDLAVSRAPHRPKEKYAHPDIHKSIREAFQAAERQLEFYKDRPKQDWTPPSGSAVTGQVAQMLPEADHGFILNNLGTQLYFHRDSVTKGDFGALKVGDKVHYVEVEGDAGPVASKVWLA
ncbi:MAG TPA: HPF/RaiA family ribosome-associated protein [Acetobacteraceae bacterium]|nr:HPF/RaiA family ribosome-associated protein [Acetobacteraceae bacterium]